MARAKKNAAKPADTEVKADVVIEETVTPETVEIKTETKKPAAKKTSAKKPAAPKKAAAPKTEERKVVIQFDGNEVAGTELIDKAKADAGIKTAKSVVVYVRPEINKVYYVIDDNTFGNFDLF